MTQPAHLCCPGIVEEQRLPQRISPTRLLRPKDSSFLYWPDWLLTSLQSPKAQALTTKLGAKKKGQHSSPNPERMESRFSVLGVYKMAFNSTLYFIEDLDK